MSAHRLTPLSTDLRMQKERKQKFKNVRVMSSYNEHNEESRNTSYKIHLFTARN